MGLESWALSSHPYNQAWPQGKTADRGQVYPVFRGTLFPGSLMTQAHLYASVPPTRHAWESQVGGCWRGSCRLSGSLKQEEAMGTRGNP